MHNMIIDLRKIKYQYNKETKTIVISEKDTMFATNYTVISDKTGETKLFELSHSTGPEFDPKTRWVYKDDSDITLEVCNDKQMTKMASKLYLDAKINH